MPMGFGTEEMEAVITVDVMRRAGAVVTLASVEEKLEVETSGGTLLVADTFISACSDEIFDLVALPVSCKFVVHCIAIYHFFASLFISLLVKHAVIFLPQISST